MLDILRILRCPIKFGVFASSDVLAANIVEIDVTDTKKTMLKNLSMVQ